MLPSGYLTGLENNRFSKAYRQRLAEGLQHLRAWALHRGITGLADTKQSNRWRDAQLAQYVQDCFDAKISQSFCKHTTLATQHLCHTWAKFSLAWASIRSRSLQLPTQH